MMACNKIVSGNEEDFENLSSVLKKVLTEQVDKIKARDEIGKVAS